MGKFHKNTVFCLTLNFNMKKVILMVFLNIVLHNFTCGERYYLVDTEDANEGDDGIDDPEDEKLAESMIIKKMDSKDQKLFDALPRSEKTEVLQKLGKDIKKMKGPSKTKGDYFLPDFLNPFKILDKGLKFLKHCTALFLKIIAGAAGGAAAVLHHEPPEVKKHVCGLLKDKEQACSQGSSQAGWKSRK